jgi:hypothetical protein
LAARFLLARDPARITRTLGIFLAEVFKSHRRRARALGLVEPECGAITFVQYFGSALNGHLGLPTTDPPLSPARGGEGVEGGWQDDVPVLEQSLR